MGLVEKARAIFRTRASLSQVSIVFNLPYTFGMGWTAVKPVSTQREGVGLTLQLS